MPIPSLNLALKPRTHTTKTSTARSVAEPSRLPHADDAEPSSNAPRTGLPKLTTHSNATTLSGKDVDSKRRSFLPQRGDARQHSRQKNTEEESNERRQLAYTEQAASNQSLPTTNTQHGAQRLRPRSLYQVNVDRSAQRESNDDSQAQSLRPPHALSKLAQPRPAGLNRSQSLRKPNAQTQQKSERDVNSSSHTRTQSGITATSRGEAVEFKTRLDRPRSLYVTSQDHSASNRNALTDNNLSEGQASTRSTVPERSVSIRKKPEVTENSISTSASRIDQQTRTTTKQRREPVKDDAKKPGRPAFSTLQQHFTPRKTGKAPTSTFLHPTVQDDGPHVLTPELCNLQAQLLQFHLLHQVSVNTNVEWERSAMKSLHEKFDQVVSYYQAMRNNERQDHEQKNLQALRDWNSGNAAFSLAEQMQLLSGPLHEIPSLIEPGGRLGRLADDFDGWLAWVQEVHSARATNAIRRGGGFESAESLGDSWKSENAALTRKLTAFTRDLDRLSQPTPDSIIACIVATCKELLGLILGELHAMQTIEADVVATEKEWVEAQLRGLGCDVGARLDGVERAAWRL